MALIDFMSEIHMSTHRDYLARVNDLEMPKPRAAKLAKKWDYEYWDGDRRVCYGGYQYIPGRWVAVARAMSTHYCLKPGDRVLDIGCGKGFQLADLKGEAPGISVYGLDISEYAIRNSHEETKKSSTIGCASKLPFPDDYFDFVFSINTLHNLPNFMLFKALQEIERVGKKNKYICVESYTTEEEKANLLYWQVTCETFFSPEEWHWFFDMAGYTGDYSFIFFN